MTEEVSAEADGVPGGLPMGLSLKRKLGGDSALGRRRLGGRGHRGPAPAGDHADPQQDDAHDGQPGHGRHRVAEGVVAAGPERLVLDDGRVHVLALGQLVGVASQAKTATLLVEATPTGIRMSYPLLTRRSNSGPAPRLPPRSARPCRPGTSSTDRLVVGAPGAEEVFVLKGQSLGRVGELTEASAGLPPQAGDLFGATL
jgi:hypothetical protein